MPFQPVWLFTLFYGMRLGLKQSRCIMIRKGRLKNIQTAFFR
jgi:hypothetical protein